jgi:2-polyprenyl-6-methoxyphenol hydroxylase-like FAD-dependent oxidoreductase
MTYAQGRRSEVACRFLVAADGARSRTRAALGVRMAGRPALQHLVNVHFSAPDLARRLAGREAMLYFVFGPKVIAVLVAHNLRTGEFVAQVCCPVSPDILSPPDPGLLVRSLA